MCHISSGSRAGLGSLFLSAAPPGRSESNQPRRHRREAWLRVSHSSALRSGGGRGRCSQSDGFWEGQKRVKRESGRAVITLAAESDLLAAAGDLLSWRATERM